MTFPPFRDRHPLTKRSSTVTTKKLEHSEDDSKSKSKPKLRSALVVLSGGQDSTTCLFWALQNYDAVGAISFDYGQRHVRELDSAAFVYELARLEMDRGNSTRCRDMLRYRMVKKLGNIFEGLSPLTNPMSKLETYNSIEEMDAKLSDRIELTFVPGRNAVFLSIAYGVAVALNYDDVVTGVNEADAGNYPDCTPVFVTEMQAAMRSATRSNVGIVTPLQGLEKLDIVTMAEKLPGCWNALAFTTSDYAGEYPPGKNHASVLRAHGFAEAERDDPLVHRAYMEGLL